MGSGKYWDERYKSGGNSGGGSYGRLAQFKADFLNAFIEKNHVHSVVEWGCGDGNQLSLIRCKSYTGLDVSPAAIALCKAKFAGDKAKEFMLSHEFSSGQTRDLAISLDVIYHLIEDDIYQSYMTQLFHSASRFVIIYSCNFENNATANHVKPRKFTDYTDQHFPQWELIEKLANPYPMTRMNDPETSWSDFYVFRKSV